MKTIATVGTLALVVALGGCGVQNRTSIEVTNTLSWDITAGTSGAAASCKLNTALHDTSGTMDVAYQAFTFSEPFEVTNNMPDNTDTTNTQRLNTADFDVQKVVVSYLGTSDATTSALSGLSTEIPVAATIAAGGGKVQGNFPLIPANVGKAIGAAVAPNAGDSQTVIVRWHLEGVRKDGMPVSSGDYQFPVTVCNGCLACPTGTTAAFCSTGQSPMLCQ